MKDEANPNPSGKRAPDTQSSDQHPRPEGPRPDGVRDTIESIVLAFILAFVFRAFVVEAFVIPTGSMAPGLHGQHGTHRCRACQYPIDYGIRDSSRASKGTLSSRFGIRCPNCGWAGKGNSHLNAGADKVVANSGDRILVLKWPYDIGGNLLGPKRWDVVVFKDPQDGETNFIKRLLGLPGEVLEIIDGDIYTAPLEDVPPEIREALSQPPVPLSDGGLPNHRRLTRDQHEELAEILKIQRKPRAAQQSLWMIHYDHDYMPPANGWRGSHLFPRWRPRKADGEPAWDASTPFVHFRPKDDQEHWLDLEGKAIRDIYGYNSVLVSNHVQDAHNVADLLLRLDLFPGGSSGSVTLMLGKGSDRFFANIDADGSIRLERSDLDKSGKDGIRVPIRTARIDPLRIDRAVAIEFENLDYRVALRIDGEEVIATDADQYAPDLKRLLRGTYQDTRSGEAAVAIAARGLPLGIRHLAVYRDVFYRSTKVVLEKANPFKELTNRYGGYPGWGTTTNPILLRADPVDYFCCGDNSPQSKDSRLWWEVCSTLQERSGRDAYQFGTVPGDQLIGRAFFVYWPSGLRFLKETPAVIPNPGRMRIIR